MADIDKITASNGTTYNIKDSTARESISHVTTEKYFELRMTTSDIYIIAWDDVSKTHGIRILFGSTGIQKSEYSNGTWTSIWVK